MRLIDPQLKQPVPMDIHVALHRSQRPYYANPIQPIEDDPLTYEFLTDGRQAVEVFGDASTSYR